MSTFTFTINKSKLAFHKNFMTFREVFQDAINSRLSTPA